MAIRDYGALVAAALALVAGGVAYGTLKSSVDALDPGAIEAATAQALADIEQAGEDFKAEISVESGGVPIGAIVAWPGRLPVHGRWRECDGTPLDKDAYPALFAALGAERTPYGWEGGQFKLPDLRGFFLRGVGGSSAEMGVAQEWATARPRSPFRTDLKGGHAHRYKQPHRADKDADTGDFWRPVDNNSTDHETESAGDHMHEIVEGGDGETRPANYAVIWLIRVK